MKKGCGKQFNIGGPDGLFCGDLNLRDEPILCEECEKNDKLTPQEKGYKIFYDKVKDGYLHFEKSLAQPLRFKIIVEEATRVSSEETAKEIIRMYIEEARKRTSNGELFVHNVCKKFGLPNEVSYK